MCWSKRLLVISWTTTLLLTLILILGTFATDKDLSIVGTIVGCAWGITGVDMAVYSWKAKAENKIKLTNGMIKELAGEYGIDAVIQIATLTLED